MSIVIIVLVVAFYGHLLLGITCPVIHVNSQQVCAWHWWRIKNFGEVTYTLYNRVGDPEEELMKKLGYNSSRSILDFRKDLFETHNIIIYFDPKKDSFDKILSFRSKEERTMFLLKYF